MPFFEGFFDCFMFRRFFLTGNDATRVQDERQDEQSTVSGVKTPSEAPPAASHREQATSPQFQGHLSNEVPEIFEGEDDGSSTVWEEFSGDRFQTEDEMSEGYSSSYSLGGIFPSHYPQSENQTSTNPFSGDNMAEAQVRGRDTQFSDSNSLAVIGPSNEIDTWGSRRGSSATPTSDLSHDGDVDTGADLDGLVEIRDVGFCWVNDNHHLSGSMPARVVTRPIRTLSSGDMEVIGALFRHLDVLLAPREVEWVDFFRTMTHLGFSVMPNQGGGSAYRFSVSEPSDLIPAESLGEVITVHRPHGRRTALSRSAMRDIGRRLTNAFGWSAETFGYE